MSVKLTTEKFIQDVMDKFDSFGFREHQYPNAIGMWKEEQEALVECLTQVDPKYDWLEIGSFMGGSACLMCIAKKLDLFGYISGSNVVSVDLNFSRFANAFNRNVYRVGKFQECHQKLEISSWKLLEHYNNPISFAFIDGWHSFKGAYLDFKNVDKLLVDDGIVAFHDVSPQPYKTTDIDSYYEAYKENCTLLMSEKLPGVDFDSDEEYHKAEVQQNFALDELVAYILKERNYELVNLKSINGQTHFDRAGYEWKRGNTSPFPSFVALRKT
jgi:predicted O-methyltransferase YrrM